MSIFETFTKLWGALRYSASHLKKMPNEFIILLLLAVGIFVIVKKRRERDRQKSIESLKELVDRPVPARTPTTIQKPIVKQVETRRHVIGTAYVIDGDTITIKGVRIRLFGIDAPEIDHPFGQKSKWALVQLCKGQKVEAEILENDHFDRTVAKCLLPDGRDLSAELVKQGLALDWKKYSGGAYADLEPDKIRRKLWRTAARQKGHMKIWSGQYSKQKADAQS